jgi:hypothetical protein
MCAAVIGVSETLVCGRRELAFPAERPPLELRPAETTHQPPQRSNAMISLAI